MATLRMMVTVDLEEAAAVLAHPEEGVDLAGEEVGLEAQISQDEDPHEEEGFDRNTNFPDRQYSSLNSAAAKVALKKKQNKKKKINYKLIKLCDWDIS